MTSAPQPAPDRLAPGTTGTTARSLSRATTDRDAERRGEPGLLDRLAADPATRLLLVDARGRVALDAPATAADLPDDGLAPAVPHDRDDAVWRPGHAADAPSAVRPRLAPLTAADVDATGLTRLYLGRERGSGTGDAAGAAWIAVVVPTDDVATPTDAEGASRPHPSLMRAMERFPLSALRAVGAELDAHDAGLATPATALAAWHARSGFCPLCGGRTQIVQAGWARRCTSCEALSFPRTDPAVIMAVTDDADRIVLVHGATWEQHRYSTVAGFVEAGEPAEAAVVREVAEETGLKVASVEFVASQPWPFPRSLMLGYRARLAPGEHLARPDGAEVTDAIVLSRTEIADAVAAGTVILPGRTSIARMLIEDWYGAPIG
ncbi:NAD(+) diphosphatase [Actinomyces sp. 565]|uniref:NAD(+) diphosphatase n=1 Tax=Actinomyces sp. 565 TaxID=2057794 RepID=UPI0013A69FA1|nr:NAD(+) diphosphatase [Actinomyces sp. 565]NDR54662.1 NAD(+) diphosphatase [Actinomyces sp. 565]